MTYRIEVSSVAEAEIDRAFLQLSQVASPEKTKRGIFLVPPPVLGEG